MNIQRLINIMQKLRDPEQGCPWDLEQDFNSIAPYTLEEVYEVIDAINREDYQDLKEELGDLLFQVIYHAQLAAEQGHFDMQQVLDGVCDKLIRRHPHVFADAEIATAKEQTRAWEQIKEQERRDKEQHKSEQSILSHVHSSQPALMRAEKLQKRAAKVGFDWPSLEPVIAKIEEELDELKTEIKQGTSHAKIKDELGDLLFACVNLGRHLDVNAELALTQTNDKFIRRFQFIERQVAGRGKTVEQLSLDELDELWEAAKQDE